MELGFLERIGCSSPPRTLISREWTHPEANPPDSELQTSPVPEPGSLMSGSFPPGGWPGLGVCSSASRQTSSYLFLEAHTLIRPGA